MLEAILAFLHFSAILAWVVFAVSQTALTRSAWLNAAALERLARLSRVLALAALAVVVTGLLRVHLGARGAAWYWGNPLLHLKLTLFAVVALLEWGAARQYARWQRLAAAAGGALPAEGEVTGARRLMMIGTHLFALIPLAAVFLARGFGR